ncbi:MAG: hypothetical protein K6F77_02575 [Lachnospiraceae bacterium]|nr:hypothetical protein [Lachnospiraceae bacterium]
MKNKRIVNKWNVFKENNPTSHICVMIILVNVVFIAISAILISILPENQGRSVPELIKFAFTLMVNPSGKYTYSETSISRIITTIVVLLGMISLTGGTVGFVTSVINTFLEKSVNNPRYLKIKDHIVIINYNNKVPSIIYDYSFDDVNDTYIVILTRESKHKVQAEIDNMYNQMGIHKRFKNLIIRDGNPMSKIDLEKINLKDARTVLLMTPGYNDESGETIIQDKSFEVSKLFLFITWFFSEVNKKTDIVVESSNINMEKMVMDYHLENTDVEAVPVNYNDITGKILAITAIMPSVNSVVKHFFSFEGVEVYIVDKPENLSIEDELRTSKTSLPMFDQGDKRVYIAENEEEVYNRVKEQTLTKKLPNKVVPINFVFEKSEIMIVGTSTKLPYILESLECFKNEYNNDELIVVLAATEDEEEVLKDYYSCGKYDNILKPSESSYIIVKDLYNPMDELGPIIENKADSIIFLSDDRVSDTHIDEKPLMYWTNLKKSLRENDNVDVIVEILDSQNQSIIERRNKDQIIVSDDFLGHLYAQLGKNPKRLEVIKDMITSEGDSSSMNADQMLQNQGDLLCINVSKLFNADDLDLTFKTKRELILWVYEVTEHKGIPLGVVKDDVTYTFSRTDGNNDGLDTAVLLGSSEGQVYKTDRNDIILDPDDELVMLVMG